MIKPLWICATVKIGVRIIEKLILLGEIDYFVDNTALEQRFLLQDGVVF